MSQIVMDESATSFERRIEAVQQLGKSTLASIQSVSGG
jgi:hypothetical protein